MTETRFNEFYAELTAHDHAQWLDPGVALPADSAPTVPIANVAPTPGAERLVRIGDNGHAFAVGEERWILFVPGLGAVNGWGDHPETLPKSTFAQCRLKALERAGGRRDGQSWLRVDVIDAVPFADLRRRYRPRAAPRLESWQVSTGTLTRRDDWELWYAPHDDAGYWFAAQLSGNEAHVVAVGEWVWGVTCYAEAWAGHVVIPIAAWRSICRRS
jgi:hypothetical protein